MLGHTNAIRYRDINGRPRRTSGLRRLSAAAATVGVAGLIAAWTQTGALAQAAPAPQTTPAPATPAQTPPATPAQPAPAPAAPAPTPPGTVSWSGLLDWYYGLNFNHPVSPGGVSNIGRSFDQTNNFGLNLAEVNVTRTPGKGFPLGFTATLTAGNTPPLVNANDPGKKSGFEGIQQLYLTYTPHLAGRDFTIDFGKWVTPFGAEVIESASNDNYSRSFLFNYGIPLYHAGLRIQGPITVDGKVSFIAALVNGWNNVADDNDAKSVIAGVTWKPNAKYTGTLQWMGGAESTGAYGYTPVTLPNQQASIDTELIELLNTYQATDKLKFVLDTVYASAAGTNGVGAHVSGDWNGLAAYARYQITPNWAVAIRGEQFDDQAGVGGVGLRTGMPGYGRLQSATLTLEYATLRSHLVSRLEYRHDHANNPFFNGAETAGSQNAQDTLFFSQVYKF